MDIDAFSYWERLQRAALGNGGAADYAAEEARWRRLTRDYDRNALHSSAPELVRRLTRHIELGESVLEIGPGTGGFTLPIASFAATVTALDISEAMLSILQQKLTAGSIGNVRCLLGEWPDTPVTPHDCVVAVNSLYRIRDIRSCIEAMSAAARRRVVVVWSVGHNPPVLPSLVDPVGPRRYRPGVTYIHLLLALHELGIDAEVSMMRVPRVVFRASYEEAAARLLSVDDPKPEERRAAETLAQQMFQPTEDGVVHRYDGQVAVIGWAGRGDGWHGRQR